MIRQKCPYSAVVMIGDGITDLEAVQVSGGADLFIGYGGVVSRPTVEAEADWFVTDYADLEVAMKSFKVKKEATEDCRGCSMETTFISF